MSNKLSDLAVVLPDKPVTEKQTRLTRNPDRIIESIKSMTLEDKVTILTQLKDMVAKEREAKIKDATAVLEKMKEIEG